MGSLTIVAGSPWNQAIVIKDGKNIWATLAAFEIRAQLRVNENTDSLLISNLHDYMTASFSGNDIVVIWTMNGQQTRALYALRWGNNKTGFFNLIVSDPGDVDAQALVVPAIQVQCRDTTTRASGAS